MQESIQVNRFCHSVREYFYSIADSYSPSMESLADDGNADDEYEEDPELILRGIESESWSETIDKKVLKSYKEKYVRRQDNIWGE